MSDDPYLSLISWDNHHGDLSSHFNYLFERESLVDVTVAAVGGSIKTHRLILSASSEYFQDILSEQPQDSHLIIILDDVKFQDLKTLIKFIYKGKLNLSKEELPTFLEAAKGLKIKGLDHQAQELEQIEENHNGSVLAEQLLQQKENPAPVNREAEVAPNITLPSTSSASDCVNITQQSRSTKRKRNEKTNDMASTSAALTMGGEPVETKATSRILRSNMKPSGTTPLTRKDGVSSGQLKETTLTENNSDLESEDEETGTSDSFNTPENSSSDYSSDDGVIASTSNAAGHSQPKKKVSTKAAHPTEASERPFICTKCGNSYKREQHLKRHLTQECGVKPRFPCPQCGHMCKYKYHLKRHLSNFHKVDVSQLEKYGLVSKVRVELPFKCVKCGRGYERNDSLTRHLTYECEVVPQFSCPKCELRTAQKSNLRKHLEFVHNVNHSQLDTFEATALDRRPILPIKCEICGQNFKTKEDLLEHYNFSCGIDN